MIAETFGMIALNAEMQKNYKKALHYYKLALLIYKGNGEQISDCQVFDEYRKCEPEPG